MKMTQPAVWSAFLVSHARGTQTSRRSLRLAAMRDHAPGDKWKEFRERRRNFLGRVSAAILRYVPLGYEDQNGFRFDELELSRHGSLREGERREPGTRKERRSGRRCAERAPERAFR